MNRNIRISDTLYRRLSKYTKGFDTPAGVINRLLDDFEKKHQTKEISSSHIDATTRVETIPKRGRKGYQQIQHYMLPIIRLMKSGKSYSETCRLLAEKLDVDQSTVNAQCTRTLGLKVREFVEKVENGKIVDTLILKYSDQKDYIKRELGNLYNK